MAAPNLIRGSAEQVMLRAGSIVPADQAIVTLVQGQRRDHVKMPVVLALTDQRLYVLDEQRGGHIVGNFPRGQVRCVAFEKDWMYGFRVTFETPSGTLTVKQPLPVEEMLRIAWACGWPNQSDYSLLGDLPHDPGCLPLAYGPNLTLYPDRLVHADKHLPFAGGPVQATVDSAGNIAVTRGRNLAAKGAGTVLLGPVGLLFMGNAKHREVDTRELYLLVEGPGWVVTQPCDPNAAQWVRDFAGQINVAARANADATAPPPAAASGGDGAVDQLARLADLHRAGSLTDAEFAAAKARLLGL